MAGATAAYAVGMRIALVALAGLLLASCTCSGRSNPDSFALGYFPNLTHAQALVGKKERVFEKALGQNALVYKQFNAGPAAMEALLAGSVDATYVGSGPAINAFQRSKGGLRIISGSAANGAILVVRSVGTIQELVGKRVGTPQLGNTQDIAMRHFLKRHGLRYSDTPGPDTVGITATSNADIFSLFRQGELEAAWVPEPWGARLLVDAGARLLIDERTLWEGGRFPTTVLVASAAALEKKRPQLTALLEAHHQLTRRATDDPQTFSRLANESFSSLTGKPLSPEVLEGAFSRLVFTVDPLSPQLAQAAANAHEVGLLPSPEVGGIVDDTLSREVAAKLGPPPPPR